VGAFHDKRHVNDEYNEKYLLSRVLSNCGNHFRGGEL
jgi:hypothetical protein